jgi:hypothetical protein
VRHQKNALSSFIDQRNHFNGISLPEFYFNISQKRNPGKRSRIKLAIEFFFAC